MRMLPTTMVVMLAAAAATCADGGKPSPEDEANRSRLHRPEDTAPPEQIIIPRPYTDYRAKGSMLAKARHQPKRVDVDELRRRRLDMYKGQRTSRTLPGASQSGVPHVAQTPVGVVVEDRVSTAAVAFWSFIAACVLCAAWLITRVVLSRRTAETPPAERA